MSNCPQCGTFVETTDKFCGECGFQLTTPNQGVPPFSDALSQKPKGTNIGNHANQKSKVLSSLKNEEKRRKRIYSLHNLASEIKIEQRFLKYLLACAVLASLIALSGSIFVILGEKELINLSLMLFGAISLVAIVILSIWHYKKWWDEETEQAELYGVKAAYFMPNFEADLPFYVGVGFVILLNILLQLSSTLMILVLVITSWAVYRLYHRYQDNRRSLHIMMTELTELEGKES